MLGYKDFSCLPSVFYSVVIFIKYREVSTRIILLNFIGYCRDIVVFAFWQRYGQRREKEEAQLE